MCAEVWSGCIEWTGGRDQDGYGIRHNPATKKSQRAHRWAYENAIGTIPDGLMVCHACDNPPCVNVNHLFLGTAKDNSHDAKRKGRLRRGENHGRTRLKPKQVLEIRFRTRRYRTGQGHGDPWNVANTAKRYGVSRRTVLRIVKGEVWADLPSR